MPVPPVTCKQEINARKKEDSNVKEILDLICPFDCEFDDGCGLILEWIRGEWIRGEGARIWAGSCNRGGDGIREEEAGN